MLETPGSPLTKQRRIRRIRLGSGQVRYNVEVQQLETTERRQREWRISEVVHERAYR